MHRHLIWIAVVVFCGGFDCGGGQVAVSDLAMESDLSGGGDLGPVTASFHSLYGDYLGTCKSCHAPSAPGRTSDIEMTLDFSSLGTAYTTLTTGSAVGLMGAPMACNGVAFIDKGKPATSLALAVLDPSVRTAFDQPSFPMCDQLTITDETVKVGTPPSSAFLTAFRGWIQAGALND